jgi:hypothetical protein
LQQLSYDEIKLQFPIYYSFLRCITNIKYPIEHIDSNNKTVIYVKDETEVIGVNAITHESEVNELPCISYHDILFLRDIFVFISEEQIMIMNPLGCKKINAMEGWEFARAALQQRNDDIYLIVLTISKHGYNRSSIMIYLLSFTNK